MNIFILSDDPRLAAEYQCDKHVCKMVLESTQMLCLALPAVHSPYKRAYENHPCSKWTLETEANYRWLLTHAEALNNEYTYRYGKIHKCGQVLSIIDGMVNQLNLPSGPLTPFVQVMPDEYKNPDPVVAYRNYYLNDKIRFAKWSHKRKAPLWWYWMVTLGF